MINNYCVSDLAFSFGFERVLEKYFYRDFYRELMEDTVEKLEFNLRLCI